MSSNPPASTAVVITLPTTRTDGSALALSDIASCVLSKAVLADAAAKDDEPPTPNPVSPK